MKKLTAIIIELVIVCAYTAVYVALTEKFTLVNVLIGLAISIIAMLVTRKILLTTRYSDAFTINGYYIVYVFYLFFVILKSAIFSLAYIFLDVLPEIIHEFPVFQIHVESPPFFVIMMGFVATGYEWTREKCHTITARFRFGHGKNQLIQPCHLILTGSLISFMIHIFFTILLVQCK